MILLIENPEQIRILASRDALHTIVVQNTPTHVILLISPAMNVLNECGVYEAKWFGADTS
ncbi:MAG: hypothetical protein OXE84_09510 [Rhodobacteraceae bacterium]|nr:hypothetical protein [Paracoccaceae bacterium]MCY4197904.1 hypothetical protein [Paracoccaceae bacterium]